MYSLKFFLYFVLIVLSTVGTLSECQGNNVNISINRLYYSNNGLINQIVERHYVVKIVSKTVKIDIMLQIVRIVSKIVKIDNMLQVVKIVKFDIMILVRLLIGVMIITMVRIV